MTTEKLVQDRINYILQELSDNDYLYLFNHANELQCAQIVEIFDSIDVAVEKLLIIQEECYYF